MSSRKAIFESLYQNIDGYAAAYEARRKKNYFYMGHIYGEVTPDSFIEMISLIKPQLGEVFYDLGSGAGKAVMLAALEGVFSKAVGIEVLPELHQLSQKVLDQYQSDPSRAPFVDIQFILGDFKEKDFRDADVLFISASCMHYELNHTMVQKLGELKKGARILTNGLPLHHAAYTSEYVGTHNFSWGVDEVFVHKKVK